MGAKNRPRHSARVALAGALALSGMIGCDGEELPPGGAGAGGIDPPGRIFLSDWLSSTVSGSPSRPAEAVFQRIEGDLLEGIRLPADSTLTFALPATFRPRLFSARLHRGPGTDAARFRVEYLTGDEWRELATGACEQPLHRIRHRFPDRVGPISSLRLSCEQELIWFDAALEGAHRAGARGQVEWPRYEDGLDLLALFPERAQVLEESPADPIRFAPARRGRDEEAELLAPSSDLVLLAMPQPDLSPAFEMEVDVPAGAILEVRTLQHFSWYLELVGKTPDEWRSTAGGVRFEVSVAGAVVLVDEMPFSAAARSPSGSSGLLDSIRSTHRLPLSDLTGQRVTLRFTTSLLPGTVDPPHQVAWERITLRRARSQGKRRFRPGSGTPNVLLIVLDTIRADHLGCYGYHRPTSPHLDRWAAEGLRFEQALAPSPWTLPSVATLMTGISSPLAHGVLSVDTSTLSDALTTLPEALELAGVVRAAFVANPVVSQRLGYGQGFDVYKQPGSDAVDITDSFLRWVRDHRDLSFFAYLHYFDPHAPYEAPGEFREHFGHDYEGPVRELGDLVALFREGVWRARQNPGDPELARQAAEMRKLLSERTADLDYVRDRYDSEIRYWDLHFGRLLAGLEKLGLDRDLVIVLVGDHGEELLDHGGMGHMHSTYNELLRVPLIVWAPGRVTPGTHEQPTSIAGVFHSILSWFGSPSRGPLGEAPLPTSRTPTSAEPLFAVAPEGTCLADPLFSVLEHPWKLIWQPESDECQLFHVSSDPLETVDLSEDEAPRVQRLVEAIQAWQVRSRQLDPGPTPGPDARALDELRRLGYIQGR